MSHIFNNSSSSIRSTNNSTTTPLVSGATWSGTAELAPLNDILFTIECDQTGEYFVQVSQDNSNFITIGSYKYRSGGVNRPHRFTIGSRYVRLVFVNTSSSDQTYLRITSSFGHFNQLTLPFNGTLARDSDTIPVFPTDFNLNLSRGAIDGYTSFTKFGYNGDVDSAAEETVWSSGGKWTPMTSADYLRIVSSSSNDNSSGTGARIVNITGIGSDGMTLSKTYSMSGTTSFYTDEQWLGVNRVQVVSAGNLTYNVGNILVTGSASGLTQGYITNQVSITEQMIFTVPEDSYCYINRLRITSNKLSGGGQPRISFFFYNYVNGVRYQLYRNVLDVSVTNVFDITLNHPFKLEPGSRWYINVSTTVDNTFINGYVEQTLVKKEL